MNIFVCSASHPIFSNPQYERQNFPIWIGIYKPRIVVADGFVDIIFPEDIPIASSNDVADFTINR